MGNEIKTIIFDFDGTIADTLGTIFILYNKIAHEYNCQQLSKEDVQKFRTMNINQIIKEYNFPVFLIPVISLRIKSELKKEIKNIKPIEGTENALKNLQSAGYKLGVMSSNSLENINLFLKKNNIFELFDFVHSGKNIFGKDKVILRLLAKHKINRNSVIYVGDETRDIEAMKRIKIPIVAVSWGFNSHAILEKLNPEGLIDEPSELLGKINDLSATRFINP